MPDGDHQARLVAQREFVRPLVIEAGAGTGKTAILVARILAWSLGPGWTKAAGRLSRRAVPASSEASSDDRVAAAVLGRVVAITFTEAAAAEMAERVTAGFATVERGGRPVAFTALDAATVPGVGGESARRRAGALLGAVDQLQVRTIHSFCRKLLADHPFEAGIHPHFTVDADATVLGEVVEEAVESAALEGYGDPGDPDWLTLAGRGFGPQEIAGAVFELAAAGRTSAALAEDPLAPKRRRELLERLWQATNRLLTLLETRRVSGTRARNAGAVLDGLGKLRRRLRRARRSETVDLDRLKAWLDEGLPPNLTDHLRLWTRGETANQAEKERLASAREQLMPLAAELRRTRIHAGRLDPDLLACSRRVLAALLDRVHEEMRARGALGFADLLREARALFTARPKLVADLRRRVDQLLVDELQDTDPLQCDLIRRLALTGPPEERPGLFVVGDPKQSIYGWRNADLTAYEGLVGAALEAGGRLLALDENFRSVAAILDEVARVVRPVMRRQEGLQPEFRHLKPSVGERSPAGRAPVEHWISWRSDPESPDLPIEGNARETGELEARALAADLLDLRRDGVAWSDVGILLRSLTDLETYLSALREAGIPFVVSRDRQYYRRREIIDAAALVRAVLAPEDRLALLTFLRTVAVGVPDAALSPLWSGGLPGLLGRLTGPDPETLGEIRALAEEVAGGLPADVPGLERVHGWEHNLLYAAGCLAGLRRSFDEDPVDLFVEGLRRSTLFEACESARYLGVFRQANLDRFFFELLTALEEEEGNPHRVLRRLRTRVTGGFEAEEARPAEATEDAVRILTIHKAKGLEFRHVYLLQTHKEAGQRSTVALEIGEHGDRTEYRVFGAATLGFDELAARRQDVARAELVRTLYVALTRASERLVVTGRRPLTGAGPPLELAATHMDLLLFRQGDSPSPADLAAAWSGDTPRLRAGDVAWCFPARLEPGAGAANSGAGPAPLPASIAEIRSTRDRLSEECAAAERHMARPFRQVASKAGGGPEILEGAAPAETLAERRSTAFIPAPDPSKAASERRGATAAGSAIHRALETFDLATDPAVECARQRRHLPGYAELFTTSDDLEAAVSRAEDLWDRFTAGPLLDRFLGLGDGIVARELPVLLPPRDGDDAVGYLAGIVDLVYRDPAGGKLVVADFKTDRLTSEAARHALRYAAQGEIYVRAVAEMLHLERVPRFELWYLGADHVEVVER